MPTPQELLPLTVALIHWADRHLHIDMTPVQRFYEVVLLNSRRAKRGPAFDQEAAFAKLEESFGEADGTLNRVASFLTKGTASIPKQSVTKQTRQRNVLVSLGAGQYTIGKHRPIAVTPTEDAVLQAFLDTPTMTDPTLKAKTKQADPGKVLRRLRTKYDGIFAPAITTPGGKSQGGYHVQITSKQAVSASH
jgi:hypothetical protein